MNLQSSPSPASAVPTMLFADRGDRRAGGARNFAHPGASPTRQASPLEPCRIQRPAAGWLQEVVIRLARSALRAGRRMNYRELTSTATAVRNVLP